MSDRHGFRGGKSRTGEAIGAASVQGLAIAQLVEHGHQNLDHRFFQRHLDASPTVGPADLPEHNIHLVGQMTDRPDFLEVHSPLQGSAHPVHTLVDTVGRGDNVKTFPREHHTVLARQLGNHHHPVGQHREQRILQRLWAAGDLFKPDHLPFHHAPQQGAGYQRLQAGALGMQYRFVPAIQQLPDAAHRPTLQG